MKTQNSRNAIDRSPLRSGLPRKQQVPRTQAMGIIRGLLFIALAFACFALLPAPKAFGVVPAPDGGYPGFNTAEGQNALLHLTTGTANTAVGWVSLENVTTGSFNTGVGAGALLSNTADGNTAFGTAALLSNTTGAQNTAVGTAALLSNTAGGFNNTAVGYLALYSNTTGGINTAIGNGALQNNTTGGSNVALGSLAGFQQTSGSNNVYIGAGMQGVAGESSACYIGSIFGQTTANGIPVLINSGSKLGTSTSSKRFKQDIQPMDNASDALFALKPVTFHYKKELDPGGTPQFGLVAEEVAKVNPHLVVRDEKGEIYTVRYEAVNAMLLNEFLKEHRRVEEQQATISQLKRGMETVIARLKEQDSKVQKVSAQLELQKAAPKTVLNNE